MNFLSANSLFSGFLSGCHCRAFRRYLQEGVKCWHFPPGNRMTHFPISQPLSFHRSAQSTQLLGLPLLPCFNGIPVCPLQPVVGLLVLADDNVRERKPQPFSGACKGQELLLAMESTGALVPPGHTCLGIFALHPEKAHT